MIDFETIRAVVEAARMVAEENRDGDTPESAAIRSLVRSVDDLEAEIEADGPNEPVGPLHKTPWEEIPAGSFVQVPNGQFFEILGTKRENAKQMVTLKSPDGKRGTFPRDPRAEVPMKSGSRNKSLEAAIDALRTAFGPVTVEDDTPPWDED